MTFSSQPATPQPGKGSGFVVFGSQNRRSDRSPHFYGSVFLTVEMLRELMAMAQAGRLETDSYSGHQGIRVRHSAWKRDPKPGQRNSPLLSGELELPSATAAYEQRAAQGGWGAPQAVQPQPQQAPQWPQPQPAPAAQPQPFQQPAPAQWPAPQQAPMGQAPLGQAADAFAAAFNGTVAPSDAQPF